MDEIRWSLYGVILGILLFVFGGVLLLYNILNGIMIDLNSIHIVNVYIMIIGLIILGFSGYYYIRYDMWGK